jgi:hypothetical protein
VPGFPTTLPIKDTVPPFYRSRMDSQNVRLMVSDQTPQATLPMAVLG